MSTKTFRPIAGYPQRRRQEGATLFVALVFLVMLTIIGISMFGTTTVEERMSRNYRNYSIAMQSAEAGLRDAEIRITGYWVYKDSSTATPLPIDPLFFSSDCTNGLCNAGATQPVYDHYMGSKSVSLGACPGGCDGNSNGTGTGSPSMPAALVAIPPKYLIETITWTPSGASLTDAAPKPAYRITAVGYGPNDTTKVMQQEVYLSY